MQIDSDILNKVIKSNHQKTFFIDRSLGELYKYEHLPLMVKKFKTRIGENKFKKSDIGIVLTHQSSYLPVLLTAWTAKKIPCVLDPNTPDERLNQIISYLNLELLITDNPNLKFNSIKIPVIKYQLHIPTLCSKFLRYDLEMDINIPCVVLLTSGSTGLPKFVPLSLKNILTNLYAFSNRLNLTKNDTFLCTSPPYYAHGLYNSLFSSFFLGAKIVSGGILNVMNVTNILSKASEYKVTVYHLTPSMIKILNTIAPRMKQKLPLFKFVICGTSRLEKHDKAHFEKIFNVVVSQQYGMTETLFMTVNHDAQLKFPDSVGKALECELQTKSNHNFRDNIGEIICKSPSMFGSYYKQPEETKNSYQKGWFKTGDIGYFNKDGYLYITGRCKEIIKKGGYNINPNEIDEVISSNKKVKFCKTIGVPNEIYGEDIVSCIVKSNNSLTKNEIFELCREKLPQHYIPSKIIFLKDLPLTSTGKVDTASLKSYFIKKSNENQIH